MGFFSAQRGPEVRRRISVPPVLGYLSRKLSSATASRCRLRRRSDSSAGSQTPPQEVRRTAALVHAGGQCQSPQCRVCWGVLEWGGGICSRGVNKVHWNMKKRFSGSLLHSQHASLSVWVSRVSSSTSQSCRASEGHRRRYYCPPPLPPPAPRPRMHRALGIY